MLSKMQRRTRCLLYANLAIEIPSPKVTNCKFFAGKAEDILPNLLRDVDSKEVNTVLYI